MIKKYSGQIIGFFSAIIFFMLLAYIVKPSSEALKNENSFRVVDFIRLKKDTSLKEKSRAIPDKPEPPKKPPYMMMPSPWADSLMRSLRLDQKIGQLFMVAANGRDTDEAYYLMIDSLIGNYQRLISQHRFHNSQIKMMKATDPIAESKRSFAGIKRVNPFNEFKKKPIPVPSLTPQHRLMKDSRKLGTLWDPTFSLSDVSVNPKIKHFYKRYLKNAR